MNINNVHHSLNQVSASMATNSRKVTKELAKTWIKQLNDIIKELKKC